MAKPQFFNFNPLTCGVIEMREMALSIDGRCVISSSMNFVSPISEVSVYEFKMD